LARSSLGFHLDSSNHSIGLVTIEFKVNRANPSQWSYHIAASTAIVFANINDALMVRKLRSKIYINNRHPGRVKFIDTVKSKIGEQDLGNRLGFLHSIICDWLNKNISKDALRVTLKSSEESIYKRYLLFLSFSCY